MSEGRETFCCVWGSVVWYSACMLIFRSVGRKILRIVWVERIVMSLGLGTGVVEMVDCHAEGFFLCWRIGTWIDVGVVGWWT